MILAAHPGGVYHRGMKRRRSRRSLGSAKLAKVNLVPYGFQGPAETSCAPAQGNSRIRVCLTRPSKPGPAIQSGRDACRYLKNAVNADRESFYAIHLDTQNRAIGVEEIAKGSIDSVETSPREVFKAAILSNAKAILVAHNHPSGNATPSNADIDMTANLIRAGNFLGIPIRDHVIVAAEGCTSIRELVGEGKGFMGAKAKTRRKRSGG